MRFSSLLVVGTAAWLISCSTTWDIDRYEAPEADFAARRTFSWKPGQFSTPVERSAAEAARVDSAVQAAIEQELQRKGYTKVATGADMIVSYQIAGHRKYVLSDERRVGAPSPNEVLMPSGSVQLPPTSVVPSEQTVGEGSMIVFVDDPATGKLIWRGVVTAETRVGSPEAGARLAADMARQIVCTIPGR
jgi:hypothetical protein